MSVPFVQTNTILRRLGRLTCSLEDYQTFREADMDAMAADSSREARESITKIREALDRIEDSIA